MGAGESKWECPDGYSKSGHWGNLDKETGKCGGSTADKPCCTMNKPEKRDGKSTTFNYDGSWWDCDNGYDAPSTIQDFKDRGNSCVKYDPVTTYKDLACNGTFTHGKDTITRVPGKTILGVSNCKGKFQETYPCPQYIPIQETNRTGTNVGNKCIASHGRPANCADHDGSGFPWCYWK